MNEHATPVIRFVDTPQDLKALASRLEREPVVAVDLEADSMYHFQEKVCLLQVAAGSLCAVIDPTRLDDLSCLGRFFADSGIRKVFHGADYDVRSLYRDFRIVIRNLFDTQIACMFLGIRETGLNAVLGERFGITLDKKYQRKDWSVRPLPDDMVEYAARDTLYLAPLAEQLEVELAARGRLGWVREECELLSRVRPAEAGDTPLFLRFKGAGKLSRRSLAVLEALLGLRRRLAEKKDRPPYKVVSNQSLMALAGHMPSTPNALARLGVLSPRQVQMHAQAVLEAIQGALDLPEEGLPVYPRRRPEAVPPDAPPLLQALKAWRDRAAADLQIDPGVLINNSLLGAIAVKKPGSAEELARIEGVKNWQLEAFGPQVLAVVEGGRRKAPRARRRQR